jgi:hypothetical protein
MTDANKKLAVVVALAVAVTWFSATSDYSPVKPRPDRPVLRLIQRLARMGLWVAMFAEPAPQSTEGLVYHAQAYDEKGQRILDHGKGW